MRLPCTILGALEQQHSMVSEANGLRIHAAVKRRDNHIQELAGILKLMVKGQFNAVHLTRALAAGSGARPQHLQKGSEGVSGRPGPATETTTAFRPKPMNQLQVDLADMGQALPLHAGGHRCADQKSGRAAEGPSCDQHCGGHEEGVPSPGGAGQGQRVLRRRLLMDFWDIKKQAGPRLLCRAHHPHHQGEPCIAAGAGRRGQWHLMLPDVLNQINGRKHATTQVAPNLAYSDPEMAETRLLCATSCSTQRIVSLAISSSRYSMRRALGLEQRILARPLAQHVVGRPLHHQSKAGSVLAHPRSGLLQKPWKAIEEVILSSCGGSNKYY